jgi:hypothetical protein
MIPYSEYSLFTKFTLLGEYLGLVHDYSVDLSGNVEVFYAGGKYYCKQISLFHEETILGYSENELFLEIEDKLVRKNSQVVLRVFLTLSKNGNIIWNETICNNPKVFIPLTINSIKEMLRGLKTRNLGEMEKLKSVQRRIKQSLYDPNFELCRKILKNEFFSVHHKENDIYSQ